MKKSKVFLLAGLMVLTVTGFVLGNAVNAAVSSPGSSSDPLVTKSYVDKEVNKLQEQINSLKNEINTLKGK